MKVLCQTIMEKNLYEISSGYMKICFPINILYIKCCMLYILNTGDPKNIKYYLYNV